MPAFERRIRSVCVRRYITAVVIRQKHSQSRIPTNRYRHGGSSTVSHQMPLNPRYTITRPRKRSLSRQSANSAMGIPAHGMSRTNQSHSTGKIIKTTYFPALKSHSHTWTISAINSPMREMIRFNMAVSCFCWRIDREFKFSTLS